MLFDLKVKTKDTSTSATQTISRNEKKMFLKKTKILTHYLLFLLKIDIKENITKVLLLRLRKIVLKRNGKKR